MKKGHYLGGSTLGGFGAISKPRGRRGGIGSSGGAVLQERLAAANKMKRELAATIRSNEKVVKQLGTRWAAEKARTHYDNLIKIKCTKTSPLAAALNLALLGKNGEDNG